MGELATPVGHRYEPFPSTHWSVVQDVAEPESPTYRASIEYLSRVYWPAVYSYIRAKWRRTHEDTVDLTQDFFLLLYQKKPFQNLTSDAGRFRTYVKTMLDNVVRMSHRKSNTQKRGGGIPHISIEASQMTAPSSAEPPDTVFLREWAAAALNQALEEMREEYEDRDMVIAFQIFIRCDVDPDPEDDISYDGLAKRFGVSPVDVRNYLHRARKRLRQRLAEKVRETVCTRDEAESEMSILFGGLNP